MQETYIEPVSYTHLGLMIVGILLTTAVSVLSVVNPYISGQIVDQVISGGTVSYTHLGKLMKAYYAKQDAEKLSGKGDTSQKLTPVSYTHLDVYKRQKIDNVDLSYIEPIDITTIFGNLLDNAIEAAANADGRCV